MRRNRITLALALVLAGTALSGCVATPRPARTEITPGESEIISERDERRPSESTMRIRTTIPPVERESTPPVRIRIILPDDRGEGGAE